MPPLEDPILNIVLIRPEIPQNTGSIARLAAAVRTPLHLVGPLGFSLEDRYLKRAGLDYWPLVDLRTYANWVQFVAVHQPFKPKLFSTHAKRSYIEAAYERGDFLLFGGETKGLGRDFIDTHRESAYRIPIFETGVRSLNLANAASIVVYEALRQLGAL
jgi:tRNA (cytidine/uridine-2'-O-)-methyltransferase